MKERKENQTRKKILLVLFGFFLSLAVLELGLRAGGFLFLSIQHYRNRAAIRRVDAYRILCIGESTTAKQYPPHLQNILDNFDELDIEFSVIDKGRVGTNTSIILSKIETDIKTYSPDMVITMMGINDYGAHMPTSDIKPAEEQPLIKSLRIYNLWRLLLLHISSIRERSDTEKAPLRQYVGSDISEIGVPAAEQDILLKALEEDPENTEALLGLALLYRNVKGKFNDAEKLLRRAITAEPDNDTFYYELGLVYEKKENYDASEYYFKKTIELNPEHYYAHNTLGAYYSDTGKISEAEELLQKAVSLNPYPIRAHFLLGEMFFREGRLEESEKEFLEILEMVPKHYEAIGNLARIYQQKGDEESAAFYRKKKQGLKKHYVHSMTVSNYRSLHKILNKKGITHMCVQYPMRAVEPLKNIFRDSEYGADIIFVDNEKVFQEAVAEGNYWDYFIDSFAGDFGHCTEKGNKLLAENIAKAILGEAFGVDMKAREKL